MRNQGPPRTLVPSPFPSTKLRRQIKDLAALPFLRLCLVPGSGSTVEARGSVIVSKSTRWLVGRVEVPQRQVGEEQVAIHVSDEPTKPSLVGLLILANDNRNDFRQSLAARPS
jgi:hypothetical protein